MPEVTLSLPVGVQTLSDVEACRLMLEHWSEPQAAKPVALEADTEIWLHQQLQQVGAGALQGQLEALGKSAPLFELEFATEPSDDLKRKLIEWLRHSLHPHILIRVSVNRQLIGGMRLRTGKHMYDLSLANSLRNGEAIAREVLHA